MWNTVDTFASVNLPVLMEVQDNKECRRLRQSVEVTSRRINRTNHLNPANIYKKIFISNNNKPSRNSEITFYFTSSIAIHLWSHRTIINCFFNLDCPWYYMVKSGRTVDCMVCLCMGIRLHVFRLWRDVPASSPRCRLLPDNNLPCISSGCAVEKH